MSEPINTTGRAREGNVLPFHIEMPSDPVGVKMVPHHVTDAAGGIARTGKVEVRFDGSSLPTRNDKRRTIRWERVAYNVAQQMAYYRQVYDNIVAQKEEAERKYGQASQNFSRTCIERDEARLDLNRLRPVVNAAFDLQSHWAFFLLPKHFRNMVSSK